MFKIHNIFPFHNNRFTFYYTQSVRYPGNFWSWYTCLGAQKNEPKKLNSTPPRSFFFIRQIKLISVKFTEVKASYMLTFESSMVWPEKTTEISHKKKKTAP